MTILVLSMRYALLTPPIGVEPLSNIDLHQIQGPWFEVARLSSPLEDGKKNPLLYVRYTGEGANLTYPYADPLDPKLRIIFTGETEKGEAHVIIDEETPRLDNFKTGALILNCRWYWPCAFHLIDYDDNNRTWMVVAGSFKSQLWIFSRAPGILPSTWESISNRLAAKGYDVSKLTWAYALPPIPKILPALPDNVPPVPSMP